MNGYRDRLSQLNQMMKSSYSQNITMMSMPMNDVGQMLNQINEGFKLLSSTLPLIPSDIKEEQKNIRTQPTPPKNQQRQQDQIATAKTRVKTDNEHPTTNFFQYFFNNVEPVIESGDSIRANPSNSLHANSNPIYISFENKEIFRQQATAEVNPIAQDIMLLQSYRGSEVVSEEEEEQRSCRSTPHSPASGQTKSQYERVTSTQQIKQIPEILRERSKQTFRTLFETQPEEHAKVSPSTSEKFKNILNKVNKNQSKTQQFYQNLWPKNSSSPNRYESDDEEDQAIQTVFQSRELNSKQASSQKKWPKNELSVPSDSESSQDGKINLRDNYQKTLFCSPTFKNDNQNQSQSD